MYFCECGNETEKTVCTECGMVLDREIVNLPERIKNGEISDNFSSAIRDTSPDLESHTKHSKKTKNKELKRVFLRERFYVDNDQDFWHGQTVIKRICDSLGLPKHIQKEAIINFKKMVKDNLFEKYHIKELVYGAAVKLACVIWERPITFLELSDVTDKPESGIRRAYFLLRKEYGGKYKQPSLFRIINLYSNKFKDLKTKDVVRLIKNAKKVTKNCNICGKSLFGYAAALFYIYLKRKVGITRDEVAEAMNVTPHTITSRKREINKIIK